MSLDSKAVWDLHVLIVTGSSIFVICGDVDFGASRNRNVCVASRISCTNFRSFLHSISIIRLVAWVRNLTVSKAMAKGRPGWERSASLALSTTD